MSKTKKSDELKKAIKCFIDSHLKSVGYSNPDKADNYTRGNAFLRFYLVNIFQQFIDIDDDDIESGLVDKKNDLGIDFIYISDETVYIVQAKYDKNIDTKTELSYFISIPEKLYNDKYTKDVNAQLAPFIDEVRKLRNPSFKLIFVTIAKIDDDEATIYEEIESDYDIDSQVLAFSQLGQEYRRVLSLSDLPPDEIRFNLGNEDVLHLEHFDGDYKTTIITQQGSKLKSLYTNNKIKERLFNHNIRFWLGHTNPVNKGMIDTIREEPNNFLYYNNGITAICDSLEEDGNELVCKGLQIINGAQTVTTIAKQKDNRLSDVKVLIKIIEGETAQKKKRDNSINEQIVRFSNSQTAINASDFRSNDLVQRMIERYANSIKYTVNSPFKDVFYKRKRRREIPKARSKVITMQDVGKAAYAYKYNPYELNASIKMLWDITSNGKYYHVFGISGSKVDSLSENEITELFAVYYIFEYIKAFLKSLKKEDAPSVLFKFHLLWLVGILIQRKYSESDDRLKIYEKIVKKGIFVNSKVHTDKEKEFFTYVDKARRFIDMKVTEEMKNKGFVMRNSQRSPSFCSTLDELSAQWIDTEDLPSLT